MQAPLRVHSLEWAGQTVADKLVILRQQLAEAGAGALLVTMLGESVPHVGPGGAGSGRSQVASGKWQERCLSPHTQQMCPFQMRWPGCSTCAEETSPTTPSSSPMAW